MDTLAAQIHEFEDRLDSAITFTLVRFFYAYLIHFLDSTGVYALCVIVFIVANAFPDAPDCAHAIVSGMLRNFSILILSQHATNMTSDRVTSSVGMHASVASMHMATGISILVLATALPDAIQNHEFTRRSISILLFILTDSSSSLVASIDFGTNTIFLCVLAISILHTRQKHVIGCWTHVVKLVDMLVVNILILSLNAPSERVDVQVGLLLIVLFCLDVLRTVDQLFEESRNYAVWKIASQLSQIYSGFGIPQEILFVCSVLVLMTQYVSPMQSNATLEIVCLMSVNQLLASIQQMIGVRYDSGDFTLLVFYVIFIHMSQKILFRR